MLNTGDELLGIIRRSLAEANGVSRPHIVSLHMDGLDLVRFVHLAHGRADLSARHAALDELTAEAQAMGFYDAPGAKP